MAFMQHSQDSLLNAKSADTKLKDDLKEEIRILSTLQAEIKVRLMRRSFKIMTLSCYLLF
jgi:hypothetical protein